MFKRYLLVLDMQSSRNTSRNMSQHQQSQSSRNTSKNTSRSSRSAYCTKPKWKSDKYAFSEMWSIRFCGCSSAPALLLTVIALGFAEQGNGIASGIPNHSSLGILFIQKNHVFLKKKIRAAATLFSKRWVCSCLWLRTEAKVHRTFTPHIFSYARGISLYAGRHVRSPKIIVTARKMAATSVDTRPKQRDAIEEPVFPTPKDKCTVTHWQDCCGKEHSKKYFSNTVG